MNTSALKLRFSVFSAAVFAVLSVACLVLTGCNTWVERGPHGSGRVSAVVATDANHLWAASPGGSVWKSEDAGANWVEARNYGLNDFTALDLVLDRTDSNRMFLRTWNGFWVSTDGAATWTRTLYSAGGVGDVSYFQPFLNCSIFPSPCRYSFAATPDFEPKPFTQMLFSSETPHAPSVLLTAMPCEGLQYSTDSGEHFTQMWPFPGSDPQTNPDNCITSIAADEVTGKIYFASMGKDLFEGAAPHVYRSSLPWTAAGPPASFNWEPVNTGFATRLPVNALVWGGSADRLMAIVNDFSPSAGSTPYLFDGKIWTPKPFNDSNCFFSEGTRPLVYGGGNDFFAGGVTFAYTNNAGDTWVCPRLNLQYVDIRAIHADPSLRRVWIGGDQSALETDFVISSYPWTPGVGLDSPTGITGHGISSWQAYSVAAGAASQSHRIIVGAQDTSPACSDDNGTTWRSLDTGVLLQEAQSILWPQSGGGNVLYSYTTGGTLQRSDNIRSAATCSGVSFRDVSPPDSLREGRAFTGPHTIAVKPNDSSRVFLVSARSLIYTLDGGKVWNSASFSVPGYQNQPAPVSIFVDEDGVLYVGTQDAGAFVCTDTASFCSGASGSGVWIPWGLNPGSETSPPNMITTITESGPPSGSRNFWMGTTDGVYRRLAGETTWTKVVGNLGAEGGPFYVYDEVVVDQVCHNRIFAGIGYLADFSRTRGGIIFSSDNGANWKSISSGFGLHDVPITQIVIDPANSFHAHIYASTYGRGVWDYFFDPNDLGPCSP